MANRTPCTACSWTTERQNSCRYNSHVKLFYGVSDRGVWSLGSNFILKERSSDAPNYEARNVRFLQEKTTIPVPTLVEEWSEEDGRYFLLTKRVPGEPLSKIWTTLSAIEKECIARQTAQYLLQLRQLHSPRMESIGEQPLYSAFLFPNGYGLPHGPITTDDELWAEMEKALKGVPESVRRRLRERMPAAGPATFTHGDLTYVNIIVNDGSVTGILDWEASGYFPVWWEFACAGIGLGQEDQEWKTLLRSYLPPYEEARNFWLDFYAFCRWPNLGERKEKLLTKYQLH